MSPELQRIKIAEARGWSGCYATDSYVTGIDSGGVERDLPDYLNDLNAMAEAEKALTEAQRITYLMRLSQPCHGAMPLDPNYAEEQWLLVTRTAAQRAQAFLRCLSLWTEESP